MDVDGAVSSDDVRGLRRGMAVLSFWHIKGAIIGTLVHPTKRCAVKCESELRWGQDWSTASTSVRIGDKRINEPWKWVSC